MPHQKPSYLTFIQASAQARPVPCAQTSPEMNSNGNNEEYSDEKKDEYLKKVDEEINNR